MIDSEPRTDVLTVGYGRAPSSSQLLATISDPVGDTLVAPKLDRLAGCVSEGLIG